LVPRDHWIEEWERQAIIDYFEKHPLDGYRRLTFMALDEGIVGSWRKVVMAEFVLTYGLVVIRVRA